MYDVTATSSWVMTENSLLRTHCKKQPTDLVRFPPHNYLKENLCLTLGSGDSKNYLNAVLPIFKMTYNEMCTVFPERRRWDRDAP